MLLFSITGDIMGPALSGLDKLLKLPTGCGEQNMVKFAPNIFILEYLTKSQQLTDDIRAKALGFLKTGQFIIVQVSVSLLQGSHAWNPGKSLEFHFGISKSGNRLEFGVKT